MSNKDKILFSDDEFESLQSSILDTTKKIGDLDESISETGMLIQGIMNRLQQIPGAIVAVEGVQSYDREDPPIKELNSAIVDVGGINLPGDINLTALDVIVSIAAGVIAAIVDIVFVGTPEVVKIYRGGENFDGSIFTAALRKIGNGNDGLSKMLEWCCEKFKVPYDISVQKGVVDPNNHRLRSFGHDPFIGMLFAVVDIILGTATFIDAQGKLRVVVNNRDFPESEKYLALVYYFGHLISDICTPRGLPIPGFILTQFFSSDGSDNSIAEIAEQMYRDGYDVRHLASMSVPVVVKNMITDIYLRCFVNDEPVILETIAERQIRENRQMVYKYKLRLVSDAVGCSGNVLKFFIPPTMGNITALNISEWASLLKDTIINLKYQMRDKDIEKVIAQREVINDNWRKFDL